MKDTVIKATWTVLVALLLSLPAVGRGAWAAATEEAPIITAEQLKTLLGDPDVIIIDVRLKDQWEAADQKIPGARHEDPAQDVKTWIDKYPKGKTVVLY